MKRSIFLVAILSLTGGLLLSSVEQPEKTSTASETPSVDLKRVTTIAPFPRGLQLVDGELYVLCRGRVRGAGGVSAEINDQAGTIYKVDPDVTEPWSKDKPSDKIRENGKVFTTPTDPPFNLWDRSSTPPEADRRTDRPYCTLRYHEGTQSFYLCGFSGIDKPKVPNKRTFSKNLTDALLRYDTRTDKWYEVERHDIMAGGNYPHHDPERNDPPHGWLNGPDNCLAVEDQLYAVAKDNSVLIRYDLAPLKDDPEAGYPESYWVMGQDVHTKNKGKIKFQGHSALAEKDGYLYVGSRTSSHIVRFPLNDDGTPVKPIEPELVAKFLPYNPETGKSANLTDMDFDSKGYLYAVNAKPSRIHRFKPDPNNIYDASDGNAQPWAHLANVTDNSSMKSENVYIDQHDRLFVTSGDGYGYQEGAWGTVYRIDLYQ